MSDKKILKQKFTTNLSKDCLDGLAELRGKFRIKYDNEVIEYLVKKELANHEVGKKKR